ncbi:MAG TPA: L,D-transpeptidase family protein [Longimicrobium sp.]|nr:L,D-transpeptidase family protein [Longimicrobium sp.]
MMKRYTVMVAGLALLAGCAVKDSTDEKTEQAPIQPAAPVAQSDADLQAFDEPEMTREQIEAGRLANDWASVVQLDTTGSGAPVRGTEKWEQISADLVNNAPAALPLGGDMGGPTALRVQILLDRAFFSPGMMDGRWGKNTAKAVYFFQRREGLRTTGRVDSATYNKLAEAAGKPDELVMGQTLTAEDLKGPFKELPDSIYEQAKQDCTCYESLSEKLSEDFHATPELLAKLNPGVEIDNLQAGAKVNVPNVRDPNGAPAGEVAELLVSGRGSYVHAVDASGRVLYHFPSTLGGTYEPSPQGDFRVTNITKNPWWHFQPALLDAVPDDRPDARIPPGPNNRVGAVWMSLSAPHYGIHGTNRPEAIGYASSAGCVRLTNWDVLFLADRVKKGITVRFTDIQGRTGAQDASGNGSRVDSAAKAAGRGTR